MKTLQAGLWITERTERRNLVSPVREQRQQVVVVLAFHASAGSSPLHPVLPV